MLTFGQPPGWVLPFPFLRSLGLPLPEMGGDGTTAPHSSGVLATISSMWVPRLPPALFCPWLEGAGAVAGLWSSAGS